MKKLVAKSLRKSRNQSDREYLAEGKDLVLLRSARLIYQKYCQLHSRLTKIPLGVAINKDTHRGQLIFYKKPILLPRECFIPIEMLN